MQNRNRYSFCSALTAQGPVDFWESNLSRITGAFILQSLPGVALPDILDDFRNTLEENGVSCETFYRARGPAQTACVLTETRYALFDSSLLTEATLPSEAQRQIVQVPFISFYAADQREELCELHRQACQQACLSLQRALRVHEERKIRTLSLIDKDRAARLAQELSEEFLPMRQHRRPRVRHRFLGASTSRGLEDCVSSVTDEIPQRIFLKGGPGSGKSALLKKLSVSASSKGLDHDDYHSSLDSHSLDMLVVPAAEICWIDAAEPYGFEPSRPGDMVMDVSEALLPPGADEIGAPEPETYAQHYLDMTRKAIEHMRCADALLLALNTGVRPLWTHRDTLEALDMLGPFL